MGNTQEANAGSTNENQPQKASSSNGHLRNGNNCRNLMDYVKEGLHAVPAMLQVTLHAISIHFVSSRNM